MPDEADAWPAFRNEPLGGGRTWSAAFDSYDQYRDIVYYVVTLSGPTDTTTSFMVAVDLTWAAPIKEWAGPELTNELSAHIARVAATGRTNTTHTR